MSNKTEWFELGQIPQGVTPRRIGFTCPECDGSYFGTFKWHQKMGDKYTPGTSVGQCKKQGCSFKWNRDNPIDESYCMYEPTAEEFELLRRQQASELGPLANVVQLENKVRKLEAIIKDRAHLTTEQRDTPEVLVGLGFWPSCGCGECYAIHCLSEALAERNSFRKDATRYRKWREAYTGLAEGDQLDLLLALADSWSIDDVDAAIDESISGSGGKNVSPSNLTPTPALLLFCRLERES